MSQVDTGVSPHNGHMGGGGGWKWRETLGWLWQKGHKGGEGADWGLVECQGHMALTPRVPVRTLVGSDGKAGGTDQMLRLCGFVGCLGWGGQSI